MLQDYSNKVVTVVDNGIFIELAIRLSEYFGKVNYFMPWVNAFPKTNQILPGYGIKGLTKVERLFDVYKETDLFVFPDIYMGDVQLKMVEDGKRVFGSRDGERLEVYRDEAKELFKSLKLPVGKYKVVIGLDALREYLKKHENVYVKINKTRGDMETFDSKNYKLIEPRLDELEWILGAKKKIMKFIIEDAIDNSIEIGYDGYSIDGEYPSIASFGIEIKDCGYLGVFKDYKDFPFVLTSFNTAISPWMKEKQYRNFFSTENRIVSKNLAYMTDACCRAGSPPSETYQNNYKNLPDIIWYGTEGIMISPEIKYKYVSEIMIHSQWADKNWQPIQFPDTIRKNLKFRNLAVIENEYYVVPQVVGLPEIGAVVAGADTIGEAFKKVLTYAKQVEGYFIESKDESLEKVTESINKLKTFGIAI